MLSLANVFMLSLANVFMLSLANVFMLSVLFFNVKLSVIGLNAIMLGVV